MRPGARFMIIEQFIYTLDKKKVEVDIKWGTELRQRNKKVTA